MLLGLLLPGFFFYLGLYAPERFSRDTAPRNALATLGSVVLVAILAHSLANWGASLAGMPVAWAKVLDAMQIGGASSQEGARRAAAYYEQDAIRIPLYVVFTVLIGWGLGLLAGWLSYRGWIPGAVQFPWAYELRKEEDGAEPLTYAHVLSSVEHDGKLLLYRGRLQHFGLNSDGTFAYLALAATEQRFLDLTRGDPAVRDRIAVGGTLGSKVVRPSRKWARRAHSLLGRKPRPRGRNVGGALLMIAGSNIRNVVFQAEFKVDFDQADTHLADDPGVAAALRANYPGEFSEGEIVEEMRRIEAEEESTESQTPVAAGQANAAEGAET